jgi:hypothetical protein
METRHTQRNHAIPDLPAADFTLMLGLGWLALAAMLVSLSTLIGGTG